jgi:hypothetical protein
LRYLLCHCQGNGAAAFQQKAAAGSHNRAKAANIIDLESGWRIRT